MLKTDRSREAKLAPLLALLFGSLVALAACGDDGTGKADVDDQKNDPPATASGGKDGGRSGVDAGPAKASKDAATSAPGKADAGSPQVPDSATPDAGKTTGPGPTSPGATGPKDGDPSAPVVVLPDVKCGDVTSGVGAFLGTANLKVGGRDVILTYPCGKHEGANMTFILLLHGTNSNESSKTYTHGYFAAHTLVDSHNLIIAEPKSLASQWGNTTENPDASKDKQHLLDVIDYVYTSFAKFNLNSTWVAGHSWGAMYAKQFVCDTTVQDKVRGVIGMSGGTTSPGGPSYGGGGSSNLTPTKNCADYISQIHTVGDQDMVAGLPDQTKAATAHGCDAKSPAMDLGDNQMVEAWPNCDPGWVHEGITMGAHMHTTSINPPVVLHIIEQVKATEKH